MDAHNGDPEVNENNLSQRDDLREIKFEGVSEDLVRRLAEILHSMRLLYDDIADKMEYTVKHGMDVRERIKNISKSDAVSVDKKSQDHMQGSIKKYVGLLERVGMEVRAEYERLQSYVQEDPPMTLAVHEREPAQTATEYVEARIKLLRGQVRRIKHDLMISFSRYKLSFTSQLKQLEILEKYASVQDKVKAATANQAAAKKDPKKDGDADKESAGS
ncbi:hypothetical protein HOD08_00030 [bacterium]|jgi:hypothetical protein|nr:hypothetical protein [bacterium]